MDRMEELEALRGETPAAPPRLGGTLARAEARLRAHRRHVRAAVFPCALLVSFLALFTAAVNVSPAFAHACGSVPVVGDLAEAVAFSPSMRAAVKNGAVQVVERSQTKDGVTLGIRYVIADGKQLDLFYTLQDRQGRRLSFEPTVRDAKEGKPLPSTLYSHHEPNDGGLNFFIIDFANRAMPESLLLDCTVSAETSAGKSDAAKFTFPLRFDPKLTQKEERIELGTKLRLGGQSFTLSRAEIYPTSLRLFAEGDTGGTAWLRGLDFYVTDEKGNRFDAAENGIRATGEGNSPAMNSFRCESPYFSGAGKLYAHITGAELLDKSMRTVRIDLKNASADRLPQGVSLSEAKRQDGGWRITFTAPRRGDAMYSLFESDCLDPRGNRKQYDGCETVDSLRTDPKTGALEPSPGTFEETDTLNDYADDEVTLFPCFSRYAELKEPIVVRLK